jgi:hypothetical protein
MTVSFHVAPNLRTTQSQFPDLLRSRLLAKFTSAPSGRMNLAETPFLGNYEWESEYRHAR